MAQDTKRSLIDEVLSDAKEVRETALANAKLALEESFEPRIKSMVSRHLQNEVEEEDMDEKYDEKDEAYDETDEASELGYEDPTNADDATIGEEEDVDEELDSSDIGTSDNADPSDEASDSSEIGEGEDHDMDEKKDHDMDEKKDHDMDEKKDRKMTVDDIIADEKDDDMDEDLDLENIIKELEAELEAEDDVSDEEEDAIEKALHHHEKEFHADDMEDDDDFDVDDDEEIDLEELLSTIAEEDDDVDEIKEEDSTLAQENTRLASELDEHREALEILRGKLNEVNLLNAKLLYTTKLFRKYNLTNSQKMRVVESFDRTKSVRETKLVYSTVAESLSMASSKVSASITEGFASKPTTSTKPKATQEVIKESNEMSDRFKRLITYNK